MAQLSFLTYLRGIYNLNLQSSSAVHNVIIQAIYDCFVMTEEDISKSRLEMCLSTASGYWLDLWGEYFSVYRKLNESDKLFSKRIIDSVIRPKSTIPAIKHNIVDFINAKHNTSYSDNDVVIKEPFNDIAKYSHKGCLSNDARFFSGDYYTHSTIDVTVPDSSLVTKELIEFVRTIKASGVKVLWNVSNAYDIIKGFYETDDAYASYSRWTQIMLELSTDNGFVLSTSKASLSDKQQHLLSGKKVIWYELDSFYEWYCNINPRNTSDKFVIKYYELLFAVNGHGEVYENLLKFNKRVFSSDTSIRKTEVEVQVNKLAKTVLKNKDIETHDMILFDLFSRFAKSQMSGNDVKALYDVLVNIEVFVKAFGLIENLKYKNNEYYRNIQPPIIGGERAMWLVRRNKNWLWDTPTITHADLLAYYVPDSGSEPTVNSIIEFEDAYYDGYITFGDQYQPPISVVTTTV